ncbi:hypothetical protein VTP01DRAFT_5601 [Rhizomucor pusillus]|uniref:uncharacterized protein n=1 Tax=Rhizomucor pusillus TaxID=4840 RepID=UPI00374436C0
MDSQLQSEEEGSIIQLNSVHFVSIHGDNSKKGLTIQIPWSSSGEIPLFKSLKTADITQVVHRFIEY